MKSKNLVKEAWVSVVGLPLHLWTHETLKQIGDGCGGFLMVDKETTLRTEVSRARILVRLKGMARPNTVNILASSRSYELHIWWELSPWIADVYPSKRVAIAGLQNLREEDECSRRAKGVCSRSTQLKSDFSTKRNGDLMSRIICGPLSHTIAEPGAMALSPMPSLDLPTGGSRASGLGTPLEDPILARAESVGLSPSATVREGLKEDGPCPPFGGISFSMTSCLISFNRKRWSGPGRLESMRPSLDSIKPFRAPSPSPKAVLVRTKDPEFSTACGRSDERYGLPSMLNLSPSPSILDRIPLSEEFFGQGGVAGTKA